MVSKGLFVVLTLALLAFPVFPDRASAATVVLNATLDGESEVDDGGNPNQGDLDGDGTAEIKLKAKKKKICFDITVTGIATATLAHIHDGDAGQNGPIFVTLEPPDSKGSSSGCVKASRAKIKSIKDDPDGFYVNIHNGDFPNGALRGQLEPPV